MKELIQVSVVIEAHQDKPLLTAGILQLKKIIRSPMLTAHLIVTTYPIIRLYQFPLLTVTALLVAHLYSIGFALRSLYYLIQELVLDDEYYVAGSNLGYNSESLNKHCLLVMIPYIFGFTCAYTD